MLNQDKATFIGKVPVYIEDINQFIAESYALYSKTYTLYEHEARELSYLKDNASLASRRKTLHAVQEGKKHNLQYIKEVIDTLEPYVKPNLLMQCVSDITAPRTAELKDFLYFRRDWSMEPEQEEQLNTIHQAISEALGQRKFKKSLFLGAGAGRIGVDLSPRFEQTYLMDKSFSMAYFFHQLKEKDFTLYETHLQNIYHSSEASRPVHLSMKPVWNEEDLSKGAVEYIVGDALRLPFEDHSLDVVASVYFTDVLALKLLLPEIKRVLKKGGRFLHFGPLQYFFSDVKEAYTAEEIKEVLAANHFEVCHDQIVETLHLNNLNLNRQFIKNWCFAATYQGNDPKSIIDSETVFCIKDTARYLIKGTITNEEDRQEHLLMKEANSYIHNAESVLDILKLIDGKRNMDEVVSLLKQDYAELSQQEVRNLLDVSRSLEELGILSIVKKPELA